MNETSTVVENNRVERIWGECNPRVGFFIKDAVNEMERDFYISLLNPVHLNAVSYVVQEVNRYGLSKVVDAWNHHKVSGCKSFIPRKNTYTLIKVLLS